MKAGPGRGGEYTRETGGREGGEGEVGQLSCRPSARYRESKNLVPEALTQALNAPIQTFPWQ